jgi:hypothetical protein
MENAALSPLKLIAGIRFYLDKLNAKNAHHSFEDLCRHLARATITTNILPATGPVSAGGDQGRDFETFTSFIQKKKTESGVFSGIEQSRALVFACSLQKKVKNKIRSDVEEICSYNKPYLIYFFSNQDIAVAVRHELTQWCRDTFGTGLEILDAQALSEQLSLPSLFWIAQAYLDVPAELFPRLPVVDDEPYERVRAKWFPQKQAPHTFADFVDIKLGLRRATFNERHKADILSWINLMTLMLDAQTSEEIQRRATYEICVAALRGQNNLTAQKHHVEKYFDRWISSKEPARLRDASILLSYCSTGYLMGVFTIDPSALHSWSKVVVENVDSALKDAPGPNSLADLLQTRAQASQLPFLKGIEPQRDPDEVFKWWFRSAKIAEKAPLFDVEEFSDLLTKLAPILGKDHRFEKLTNLVDDLLGKRSKGFLIASKCRDRAVEYLNSGNILQAINELHRANVRWFTAETLRGSLLTLLTLSNAYAQLGLIYAAKYCSLSATFIIARSSEEHIQSLMVDALCSLADCEYLAGEWIAFSEHFPLFLVAHYHHEEEPDDWTAHEQLQRMVFHFVVAKAISKALGGEDLAMQIVAPLLELQMPEDIRQEILDPPLPLDEYEHLSEVAILDKAAKDFCGVPFSDCGPRRMYYWHAMGIQWFVDCENKSNVVPYVEEFVAVLQIATVGFANLELGLVPTKVKISASVDDSEKFEFEEQPSNQMRGFNLQIPRSNISSMEETRKTQSKVLAIANSLLLWCSSLPEKEIFKRLNTAYAAELTGKAFIARPYWELLLEFTPTKDFSVKREKALVKIDNRQFKPREHKELTWMSGPGFGYNKKLAVTFLRNRYSRGIRPIRLTLNRLRKSERFKTWAIDLREHGLLDWQIIAIILSRVVQFRAAQLVGSDDPYRLREAAKDFMERDELEEDDLFPEDDLYVMPGRDMYEITLMANAKTWGLVERGRTPDATAWERLLNERYFQNLDDIPHEDPFHFDENIQTG